MFYSPLEQFEILYTIIPQTVCMILTDISDVSLNFNLFLKNNYFLFLKDNFISISFEQALVDFYLNSFLTIDFNLYEIFNEYNVTDDISDFLIDDIVFFDIFFEDFRNNVVELYLEYINDSNYNLIFFFEFFILISDLQSQTEISQQNLNNFCEYMILRLLDCETCFSDTICEKSMSILFDMNIECFIQSMDLNDFFYDHLYDEEMAFAVYDLNELTNMDFYLILEQSNDILIDDCLIESIYFLSENIQNLQLMLNFEFDFIDLLELITDVYSSSTINESTLELNDLFFFDEMDNSIELNSIVNQEAQEVHSFITNEFNYIDTVVSVFDINNIIFFFRNNTETQNILMTFFYFIYSCFLIIIHPFYIIFSPLSSNLVITLIILSFLVVVMFLLNSLQFFLIPRNSHLIFLYYYSFIKSIIIDLISHFSAKQYYFQLIAFLFIILNLLNLYGLIPYTFVLTSQFSFTFFCSFIFFTALNFTGITVHGLHLFSLFFPSGAPIFIAPLLVVIEFISYFARVFSLAIRLFANITAGHILLKILSWFTWSMLDIVFASVLSTLIITVLWILEFFISVLQAYVFTILICIYLNDVLNLH